MPGEVPLLLLLRLLPLLARGALALWIECSGPCLIRQRRLGHWGRAFGLLKLRTMVPEAEAQGPQLATVGDPRITRLGHWVRRTRLDEVPQLWHIVTGDMAWIGPRPERPHFAEQYATLWPLYPQRLRGKPGLTGLAQVQAGYSTTHLEQVQKLALDLQYLRQRSLWLDLRVLWDTVRVVVTGAGAR